MSLIYLKEFSDDGYPFHTVGPKLYDFFPHDMPKIRFSMMWYRKINLLKSVMNPGNRTKVEEVYRFIKRNKSDNPNWRFGTWEKI